MAGTVAYEEGISKVARRAYGYSERDGRFERTDQSLTSSVLGDGGIYSSVEDLWRWDQALYGTRLLPAETLAMAFRAGTPTSDQSGSGYGYGWYVATYRGTRRASGARHLFQAGPGRRAARRRRGSRRGGV